MQTQDVQPELSSVSRTPVEIFGHIFAMLHRHDDRKTLLSCSLVSTTCRQLTLPHLFAAIVFRARPNHGFSAFLEFITSYPDLARWIQSLALKLGEDSISYEGLHHGTYSRSIQCIMTTTAELAFMMSKLPALKALLLDEATIVVSDFIQSPAASPPSLKRLRIYDLHSTSKVDTRLKSLCGILHVVLPETLEIVEWEDADRDQTVVPGDIHLIQPHSLKLKRLILADWAFISVPLRLHHEFFGILIKSGSLKHIATGVDEWVSVAPLKTLVQDCGRNITVMDLNLRLLGYLDTFKSHGTSTPPHRWQPIGSIIAMCTLLRKLCLTLSFIPEDTVTQRIIPPPVDDRCPFYDLLSVSSPTLRTLQIWLQGPGMCESQIAGSDLYDISTLNLPWFRTRFRDLAPVVFGLYVPRIEGSAALYELFAGKVRDALTALDQAGMLEIVPLPRDV